MAETLNTYTIYVVVMWSLFFYCENLHLLCAVVMILCAEWWVVMMALGQTRRAAPVIPPLWRHFYLSNKIKFKTEFTYLLFFLCRKYQYIRILEFVTNYYLHFVIADKLTLRSDMGRKSDSQ